MSISQTIRNICSLVLVVLDPVLRGVHHYFVREEDKRSERLVYRLLP